MENDYRVHITIRRKSEPVFTSHEFKTEENDDLYDLMVSATEFVVLKIYEEEEGFNETDEHLGV